MRLTYIMDDEELCVRVAKEEDKIVEIQSTLPGYLNSAMIVAMVDRWQSIAKATDKILRIYVTSNNPRVEKEAQRLVSIFDDLFLRVLPGGELS